MARNLTQWIDKIRADGAEYYDLDRQIDPAAFEASAWMEGLERNGSFAAVRFTNAKNLRGEPSEYALLMNTFATEKKIGVALEAGRFDRKSIMSLYAERETRARPVEKVAASAAPTKETIWHGDDVDLRRLPIPRLNEMDGAPYLTPAVVAKDRETGRYNLSWNRAMYLDETHLGIWMSPRHLWSLHRAAEGVGAGLPVALVLGHHPGFYLTAAALTKLDRDEYEVAGGIMGEPVRVTASESFGDELLVPADAEVVIEAEILPDRRCIEGPFGEFTGYEGPQRLAWVLEAKAVTARREATMLCVFGSHRDNLFAHYPIQASVFSSLKSVFPRVKDISWVDAGVPLQLVISMEKATEGEPARVAMHAMSLSNFFKHVIVVDEDIDPGDLRQVMWAVATRVQADRDVGIIRNVQAQVLDPSLETEISGATMIIDATKPSGRTFSVRAQPPEEVVERVGRAMREWQRQVGTA
ncbi:MAG: UbiD family decarboxylase [Thermoleophilia bacterium]|nr:UbiD family decarboxylase [Thermoleophilia bacterium]